MAQTSSAVSYGENWVFYAVHTMIRRTVLEWRPDLFDCTLWTGIDFEAVLGILLRGKLGMVHEFLGWSRIHEESVTSLVMMKKNTHYADWLRVLYRYGPHLYSKREFRQIAKRYERRYVRLILRWQYSQGKKAVQHHWDVLRRERGPITVFDFIDSAIDSALIRLGARERLAGWP